MYLSPEPLLLPKFPRVETVDLSTASPYLLGRRVVELSIFTIKPPTNPTISIPAVRRPAASNSESSQLPWLSLLEEDDRTKAELDDELSAVRVRVGELDIAGRNEVNIYFGKAMESEIKNDPDLKAFKPLFASYGVDWAGWIESAATQHELKGFLAWDIARLLNKQKSAWLQNGFENQKIVFKEGLLQGTRNGAVSPEVEEVLGERLDGVGIMLDDCMAMQVAGYHGFTFHDSSEIHIADTGRPQLSSFAAGIMRHELSHALLGKYGDIRRDETGAEQVAQASLDGNWFSLSPKYHASRVYSGIRSVSDALYGPVAKLFTWRYTARSPEDIEHADWHLRRSLPACTSRRISTIDEALSEVEAVAQIKDISPFSAVDIACSKMLISNNPPTLHPFMTLRSRQARRDFANDIIDRVISKPRGDQLLEQPSN
jgi:hypothetical protein